jgi:hypothetical protein
MQYGTFYFLFEEWGTGKSLPNGDFKKLAQAIRPLISSEITQDSYEAVFEGLVKLFIQVMMEKTRNPEAATSGFSYWTINPEFIYAEFEATENPKTGIDLTLGFGYDSIKPQDLARGKNNIPTQSDSLAVITRAIAKLNLKRYITLGMLQLLVDWHWWGQQVWWENPDTIGEGDEVFQIHKGVNSQNYLLTFIPPKYNIPTIPNYRPFIQNAISEG